MKLTFKRLAILLLLTLPLQALPAFKSAKVGIDGLTCSMCSNSVERLLRQLDFIDEIDMDLNENEATILFKPGSHVNIESIAQQVINAGYSVRFLKAVYSFDSLKINNHYSFTFDDKQYNFIQINEKDLLGDTELTFIGKIYIPKKEYHNWSKYISEDRKLQKPGKNTYYVTL